MPQVRIAGGLDAVISERGRRLSAGERQRLILARTMLPHLLVLVLDEATSQLPIARLVNQRLLGVRFRGHGAR